MSKFNAAFWKWFGKSKVVDSKANPLVVCHATAQKFDRFDLDKCELGCHFGTMAQAKAVEETHVGSKILKFYLSIQNPLRMADMTEWHPQTVAEMLIASGLIRDTRDHYSAIHVRGALLGKGYDGIVYLNRHEGLTSSDWDIIDKAGLDIDGLSDDDKKIRKYLPWLRDSWICFNPAQVKAINNDGTWDLDDPDIRSNPDQDYAYHATSKKSLLNIAKRGLIPTKQPCKHADESRCTSAAAIFFAPKQDQAEYWGEVVLRFPMPEEFEEDAYGDSYWDVDRNAVMRSSYFTERAIAPETIEFLHKGKWLPLLEAR